MATRPPISAPTPIAASTVPHAAAPPSERSATTGPSTLHAPHTMFPKAAPATNVQTQVIPGTHSSPRAGRPGTWSLRAAPPPARAGPTRNSALTANVAASIASAQPAPTVAISTPAITGPAISPPDIAVARTPLASIRRSGGTIAGSRPVAAGLKNPLAAPVRPERTASIQTSATPPISSAAIAPWMSDAQDVRGDHHGPPRHAVRDHAADQQRADQRRQPAGEHDPDLGRRAAQFEHRERERDAHHPVAQKRHHLRAEQQAELAQTQDPHGGKRTLTLP